MSGLKSNISLASMGTGKSRSSPGNGLSGATGSNGNKGGLNNANKTMASGCNNKKVIAIRKTVGIHWFFVVVVVINDVIVLCTKQLKSVKFIKIWGKSIFVIYTKAV